MNGLLFRFNLEIHSFVESNINMGNFILRVKNISLETRSTEVEVQKEEISKLASRLVWNV